MRLELNLLSRIPFGGRREDKKKVGQLSVQNDYALTENNQRNIRESISNLAKDSDEKNIKFLMGVAQNLKYGVNFDLNKQPNNNWKVLLQNATKQAIDGANADKKPSLESEFKRVFLEKANLRPEEKEILKVREQILTSPVLVEALKAPEDENVSNIPKNLDHFVISSEVSLKEKKACLDKLKFFLSPSYKIDEQLKDKKPVVLGEVLNDIIIKTPEAGMLTIKQVDQQSHGMCAAISICRKALAYEDKSKYIDNILTELDDKDTMMVYDISKLGQGVKVPVPKPYIDFNYAHERGYRIIDASALNWMNVAGLTGSNSKVSEKFVAFDKENFDTFHDGFFTKDLEDDTNAARHQYLRGLIKAKENIQSAKSALIKADVLSEEQRHNRGSNMDTVIAANSRLSKHLHELMPQKEGNEIHKIIKEMLTLEGDKKSEFGFIPNEEESMKQAKIAKFIKSKDSNIDDKALSSKIDNITEMLYASTSAANDMHKDINPTSPKAVARKYRKLFKAEAAYSTAINIKLNNKDDARELLAKYNVDDAETRLSKNLAKLASVVQDPKEEKMTNLLMKKLKLNSKEEVVTYLNKAHDGVGQIKSKKFDGLYNKMLLGSRKDVLIPYVSTSIDKINAGDKEELENSAKRFGLELDKKVVLNKLNEMNTALQGDISEEGYTKILNELGFKNQCQLLGGAFNEFAALVDTTEDDSPLIAKFAEVNKVPPTREGVGSALDKIAKEINNAAKQLSMVESSIALTDDNGKIINTVDEKEIILKNLEKDGVIISDEKLKKLHEKFVKISQFEELQENMAKKGQKIKNPDVYKFSAEEKEVFKKIENDLNKMHKDVTREYKRNNEILAKPLEELFAEVGQESGQYWVGEEGSSGLCTPQQVRIFGQMTDRNYYAQQDLLKAVEQIKQGVHSGVSATSVCHKEYGGHAQYIADIKPVTLIDPKTGKKEIKDAMMHDNTWGSAEHKNNWVDSMGVLRTDYGSCGGGVKGYVTDETYKNGVVIDDFINDLGEFENEEINSKSFKKMNREMPSGKFSLFRSVKLVGENPKARGLAGGMVENIFGSNMVLAGDFFTALDNAKGLSDEKINAAFERVEIEDESIASTTDELVKLIVGSAMDKGLETVDDYNKLEPNHKLKFYFKKMAIKDSYSSYSIAKEVNKAKTNEDLAKIEGKVVNVAKDDMKYIFGKSADACGYLKDEHSEELLDKVNELLNKNGLSLNRKITEKSFKKLFDVEPNRLDGSLSKTIDSIADNIENYLGDKVADNSKFQLVKVDLRKEISAAMREKAEFNISDMDDKSPIFLNAKKMIDKKFDPSSDEEFVEIFKGLQNETTEEFGKILDTLSSEDLGVEKINEYDYIKAIRSESESADSKLRFEVANEYSIKKPSGEKEKSYLRHKKFAREEYIMTYPKDKSFEDSITELYFACNELEISDAVNKNKDRMFRNYGSRPALPKIEVILKEDLQDLAEGFAKGAQQMSTKINALNRQKTIYGQADEITSILKNTPQDKPLTDETKGNIIQLLSEFAVMNQDDPGMKSAVDTAIVGASAVDATSFDAFKPHLESILGIINTYRTSFPDEDVDKNIKSVMDELNESKKIFVDANVQPKRRASIAATIDNFVKSVKNKDAAGAEKSLDTLKEDITKFHITKKPTELLKESLIVMRDEKSKDSQVAKIYDRYLGEVFAGVATSELAFGLMSLAEEGGGHIIKNEFKNLEIPKPHKKAGLKLGSKEGLHELIREVKKNSLDNKTVHLFFNQIGLNDEALEVEIKDTSFKKYKMMTNKVYKEFVNVQTANVIVSEELEKVVGKIANKNNNLSAVINKLSANIDKKAIEANVGDNMAINIYKGALTDFVDMVTAKPNVDREALLAEFITNRGSKDVEDYLKTIQDAADDTFGALAQKVEYVEKLELKEGSQAANDRAKFIENIDAALDYQEQMLNKLGV